MKQTVVPNRNMIMISVAASLAIKNKCEYLWYAAHAGDHEIYPDCRPEFIQKLGDVLSICDYHEIKFEAPFMNLSKQQIVAEGVKMNLDYAKSLDLLRWWRKNHVNEGSARLERNVTFAANNAIDPLNEI